MHTVDNSVSYHKTVSSASMSQTCPAFPKAQPTLPLSSTINLSTFMTLLPALQFIQTDSAPMRTAMRFLTRGIILNHFT